MSHEDLEFSISQYLDGSLSADETAALEARLKEDAAARRLLEEYRKLDALVKSPIGLPAIAWDKLGDHLCNVVAREAEHFEFALSQYADGTLAVDESAAVEARLAGDAGARRSLEGYRKVNLLLKDPSALPAIRWKRLAHHLSDAVADLAEPATIKLFARPWVRGFAGMAMAACLLVASAIGIRAYRSRNSGTSSVVKVLPSQGESRTLIVMQISGPESEKPQGAVVAEVAIGAGPAAPGGESPAFADGIVTRPARSLIASGDASAQDYSQMPY